MNKIDTERIKSITNQMIGYENFKKEKIMIKKQNKKSYLCIFGNDYLKHGNFNG